MRYDYIKRLIDGCRKMAEERMEIDHAELRKHYPEVMSSVYLDSMLLCDVIEEDVILNLEGANIQEIINAIDRMQRGKPYGSDKATLEGAVMMLELLKESTRGKC